MRIALVRLEADQRLRADQTRDECLRLGLVLIGAMATREGQAAHRSQSEATPRVLHPGRVDGTRPSSLTVDWEHDARNDRRSPRWPTGDLRSQADREEVAGALGR